MQQIETPLPGVSRVCPRCHLMCEGSCGYRESKQEVLGVASESEDREEKRRGFARKETYTGLGNESDFCGALVVLLNCKKYLHDYGVRLFCGREWCPRCGLDESDMHKRRYARLMDKVFYLGSQSKAFGLGYFIFTIPSQIREKFERKATLRNAGKDVRSLLNHHGFGVGVSRWHFFGDGQITEGELDLGIYHPHLNCLVTGRWVHDREMKAIKESWRRYLEVLSGESVDVVDVWYQYFKSEAQWWHKAKYITRATFKRLEGYEELAKELYDFRNTAYWGWGQGFEKEAKLKHGAVVLNLWLSSKKDDDAGIAKEEYDKLVSVSHAKCPQCADEGHAVRLEVSTELDVDDRGIKRAICTLDDLLPFIKKELKAGFYVLSPVVILNRKPMSREEASEKEVYDTS